MVGWFICVIIERDFLDIFFLSDFMLLFCTFPFQIGISNWHVFNHLCLPWLFSYLISFASRFRIFSRNCIYWMFYLFSIAFPLYLFLNFNNNKNLPVLFRFSFISFLEFQQQQKLTYSLLSSFWPSVSWLLFSPPLQKNSEKKFCLLKISVCLLMFNAC